MKSGKRVRRLIAMATLLGAVVIGVDALPAAADNSTGCTQVLQDAMQHHSNPGLIAVLTHACS